MLLLIAMGVNLKRHMRFVFVFDVDFLNTIFKNQKHSIQDKKSAAKNRLLNKARICF